MENDKKLCKRCNKIKYLYDFAIQKDGVKGRHAHCKNCVSEKQKQRRFKYSKVQKKRWNNRTGERKKMDRQKNKEYQKNNKQRLSSLQSQRHKIRRETVIDRYGGNCECCGEKAKEFLAIDHVRGNGSEEKKEIGPTGILNKIFKSPLKLSDYRILCHNCNSSLGFYGYCPHVEKNKTIAEAIKPIKPIDKINLKRKKQNVKIRTEVVEKYGGHCVCCGKSNIEFLSIDHVNGNKEKENRSSYYYKLYRTSEILKDYRVLCFNCNLSLSNHGYCPHNSSILPKENDVLALPQKKINLNTNNEECWILVGSNLENKWRVRKLNKSDGNSFSVSFDWSWVIKHEEKTSEICGWYHTHPNMRALPSEVDNKTMAAWVSCLGKPLLCVIEGRDGIKPYLYEKDNEKPILLSFCKRYAYEIYVIK
jgi:hypothetical protein